MSTRNALDNLKIVRARDRRAWRAWLERNHERSPGVWLLYYKKASGRPSVGYAEAVEEALCFGWIDSKLSSVDDESYKQVFTPRRPKSVWSKLNKERVARLLEAGVMTEAGRARVEAAKRDGSWESLDRVEAFEVPPDLRRALDADGAAARNFAAFNNSTRKRILHRIEGARRPETRARRIAEAVGRAARNDKS